jgi:integrase/recombinase XerD
MTEYLAHIRVERGLSVNTVQAYSRDLQRYVHWCEQLGREDIASITSNDLGDFAIAIQSGSDRLAPRSAARALIAVRGLHRFALREGWVAVDVSTEAAPPAAARSLPKALRYEQVEALLRACPLDGSPAMVRDRALLELLYGTGMRISEAVGLAVDDIDTGVGVVQVTGKGGKQRRLPVGGYALSAVDAYLVRGRPVFAAQGRGSPVLFLNSRGGPLSRQRAWQIIQGAARRAELDVAVSPHTLRHSYATHLLEGGADVRVVQELLGHASVTTTQIYTQVTVDTLREIYATAHPRAR